MEPVELNKHKTPTLDIEDRDSSEGDKAEAPPPGSSPQQIRHRSGLEVSLPYLWAIVSGDATNISTALHQSCLRGQLCHYHPRLMGEFRRYFPVQSGEWWTRLHSLRFLLCRHWLLLGWFFPSRASLHVRLPNVHIHRFSSDNNIVIQLWVRSTDGQLILPLLLPAFGACSKDGSPWVLG